MTLPEKTEAARSLFQELKTLLNNEGEANWIRGVDAALNCLRNPDVERGYFEARSIYLTMAEGKGAFSDFYLKREDFTEQVKVNRRFDELRDTLWQLLRTE